MEVRDPEIIARVLAGDREGFGLLVERHRHALWAFVRGREPRHDRARDLYQETLVRAFESLTTLRDPERFRAWVLGLARNLALQGLRKCSEQALGVVPESLPDESSGTGALERLERDERSAKVRRAIADLPPRQREVCELRADRGLSHAEIAELLDITEENARANFYQGMRKLRAALERDLS